MRWRSRGPQRGWSLRSVSFVSPISFDTVPESDVLAGRDRFLLSFAGLHGGGMVFNERPKMGWAIGFNFQFKSGEREEGETLVVAVFFHLAVGV